MKGVWRLLPILLLALTSISAQANEDAKINFCRPNGMGSALVYIADEQGYFQAEGLDIAYSTANSGKICQDNLVAGKGDAMACGEAPYTYLSFTPHPLVMVAQTPINPETALVARRDHGITRESDIRGKTIGYLPGTISYIYYDASFGKAGSNLKKTCI